MRPPCTHVNPLDAPYMHAHYASMTLLEYVTATGEGVRPFADRIGESRNTIQKIAYGKRQPSLALAVKIQIATKGKVKPSDMLLVVPDGMIR